MSYQMCARPVFEVTAGHAQNAEVTLRGRLTSGMPRLFSEYAVELLDSSHRMRPVRADVRSNGVFELGGTRQGEYTLSITTMRGEAVHQQSVTIEPMSRPIEIRMPHAPPNRPGAKTVSVKQLMQPLNRKAFQFSWTHRS